jgi:Trypsin Inhibitor like cysteine rich domain
MKTESVFGDTKTEAVLSVTKPDVVVAETKTGVEVADVKPETVVARQNELEYEVEAETPGPDFLSTSTVHFTQMACTQENMEWNSCGPRCYQTCAFQPRGVRKSRAVCETASATGCYAACFCKSGYVRINDKCILPVDCPSKLKCFLF